MLRNRWKIALAAALAAACAPAGAADYDLGLVAFDRGDLAAAEREFSQLAAEGDPQAQYSLAMLYLKGERPDYARAIPWLEKSAGSGLSESQYMLGMLTLYGVGTAKDVRRGMRLLESADAKGNANARASLEQLERARRRAAENAQRKARQAQAVRAELDKTRAAEQALRKRLAHSKQHEKTLASERDSLKTARAREAREKEALHREQLRLAREVDVLRAELAHAERSRSELQTAMQSGAGEASPGRAEAPVASKPGQAVVAGTIAEVLPDGVLLSEVSQRVQGHDAALADGLVVFVNLVSTDGLSAGRQVTYTVERATPYRYKYPSGATGRIRAFRVVSE